MANKNSSLFGDIASSVSKREKKLEDKPVKARYLSDRKNSISGLVSGNIEEKTLHWVDPEECRMWEYHNRRYDLLDEHRCKDLIDGIKSQGKQEFPAIVRRIDDPNYKYEVICGARRHWTISYLRNHNYSQYRFLIEVRELSDEEAFRISDIENRDRLDISDYERAIDYARAVKHFYKTQKNMAERLEVSQSWLSRYLDLAKIPEDIVSLFSDISFMTIENGRKLKPWLSEPKLKKILKDRVNELKSIELKDLPDKRIFSYLIEAEKIDDEPQVWSYKLAGQGKEVLKIKQNPNGKLSINVAPVKDQDRAALKTLVLSALEDVL